ncbi:MAG: RIP metalloprotease RseP [Rhodospirillales bacterium]|nr:RIP metalloprotease RseP [Rhodospirillales bacterium]
MEFIGFLWDYVIPFLFILTVLVFVHELGHYLIARRNGVRVEVFSVGFGREIYGWTDRVGTRWKISAVPLGGYVKMFGEGDFIDEDGEDERPLTPEEQAVSFHHKKLGQRAAIVAAGPIANFLFAIVLLAGLFSIAGNPSPYSAIGTIQSDSAAADAGFKSGDRILSIEGESILWFEDLRRIISVNPGRKLSFQVLREDQELSLVATPKARKMKSDSGEMREIGLLGVSPDPEQVGYIRMNPLSATWMAVERTYGLTAQIMNALGQIISGQRTAKELGGPLRIAQISGQMAQGGVMNLIFFMAALSINLGLINLFPIPMLDGGHLVFYMAEAVRGRPIGARAQEYSFRFGLILVLLLMVFVTWNDLVQLKVFEFLKQLIT